MSSIQSYRIKMQRTRAEAAKNPTVIKVDNERYLTSGEIAMAKLVFKDSINYSKVKIINGGFLGIPTASNSAMTPFGHIHFPSKDYIDNPDFSIAKRVSDKHWFMHEMTHVWQNQLGFKNFDVGLCHGFSLGYILSTTTPDTPKKGDLKSYATDISGADANKKFHEFNFEQQGRIIEFWYDACYLQKEDPIRPHHQRSLKLLGYVERILRDFLHNPHDKRLLPKTIL